MRVRRCVPRSVTCPFVTAARCNYSLRALTNSRTPHTGSWGCALFSLCVCFGWFGGSIAAGSEGVLFGDDEADCGGA